MAARQYLGRALRQRSRVIAEAYVEHAPSFRVDRLHEIDPVPIAGETPERRYLRFQHELVTKYRVGIRLMLARCYREEARGNPDRAVKMAEQAGTYWAAYRRHYAHLRSLPGFKPNPTYG